MKNLTEEWFEWSVRSLMYAPGLNPTPIVSRKVYDKTAEILAGPDTEARRDLEYLMAWNRANIARWKSRKKQHDAWLAENPEPKDTA